MRIRELLRELFGIATVGLAAFLLLAVVSFDAGDVPSVSAPVGELSNLAGSLGVAVGAFLIRWVGGLGALGAGCWLAHFGWTCLRRVRAEAVGVDAEGQPALPTPQPKVEPLRRITAGVVVVLVLSVVEATLAARGWGSLAHGLQPGGYWGIFLQAELTARLGAAGTSLAMALLLTTSLVLSLDAPVESLWTSWAANAKRAAEKVGEGMQAAEERLAAGAPGAALATPVAMVVSAPPAPAAPAAVSTAVERPKPVTDPLSEPRQRRPSIELLKPSPPAPQKAASLDDPRAELIEDVLTQFKLSVKVVSVEAGPNVTLFALELGRGIKVQRLAGLLDNLAISLRVPGIRLQAPIPGTAWVGLEVPNEEQEVVGLRSLLEHPGWRDKDPALPLFLGKDSTGHPLIADLAKMPHLLIAGATGSGKSVCINTILLSLLMTRDQREVQLILIDPKQVELSGYAKVPHLLHPVVTDMRQAGAVLDWAVKKMEDRYGVLAKAGVRHIRDYNELGKEGLADRLGLTIKELEDQRIPWKLPYVVLVVDELNDMMMVAQKEVEASIMRLAQKSRAVGIHVILATQRPSVDVLTGVIKSNLPSRIAFRVTSKVDSRTILDASGADKLLGNGDMLFLPPGRSQPIRAQGAYVGDNEIRAVVKAMSKAGQPAHDEELAEATAAAKQAGSGSKRRKSGRVAQAKSGSAGVYEEAVRVVLTHGKGSVSLVQRKLKLGYGRAARLLDRMREDAFIGEAIEGKPSKVLISLEDWEANHLH